MGRRTATSYDDAFCTKFRGVIHEVLNKLNDQGEIENTDVLYPRRHDAGPISSPPSRRPYTFEQFVDHLDENDSTFHNLIELLITITARKEIAKAIHLNDPANDLTTADGIHASPSTTSFTESSAALRLESRLRNFNTRTTRECQRDILRNRAVQGEIRGITQRNRRHRTSNESSPSSESLQGNSPPPTRTVFSTLNAPETGFINSDAGYDAGATSRIFRVNQQNSGSGSGSSSLVGARRWLQHDVSSIRRRLDQRLDQRREELTARQSSSNNHTSSPIPRRASGILSISRDGSHVSVPPGSHTNDIDSVYAQRFSTQSFPPESQTPSSSDPTLSASSSVPSHSTTQASSLGSRGGLDSTLAPLLRPEDSGSGTASDLLRMSPDQQGERLSIRERALEVISMAQRAYGSSIDSDDSSRSRTIQAVLNRLNETGGPGLSLERAADDQNRTNDFESFSSRRRQDRRRQSAEGDRDEQQSDEDQDEGGQRSLDRALATLSRADETLRRINQGRLSVTSQDNTNAGATGHVDNRDPLALRLEPSDVS
ncbi:uncharacterized protein FA14DRAFT_63169 [Meira miltonrushii]|uniref:Uncharacterized protein n=1 Tax=Meira miltonrushii TaxID=1280837 RepID=A0A316V8J4_9BASI|nr:uncharacterized protein FA14DRAFT_63169 [Meira miltonrushii]PWN33534.1 hypothetical protein FA14DRAFT_63169 [Meira miltonrushii]